MPFANNIGSSCADCLKQLSEKGKLNSCSMECYSCPYKIRIIGGDRYPKDRVIILDNREKTNLRRGKTNEKVS